MEKAVYSIWFCLMVFGTEAAVRSIGDLKDPGSIGDLKDPGSYGGTSPIHISRCAGASSSNCRTIACSSLSYNYAECSVGPRERIVSIAIEQQNSRTTCTHCYNWGAESLYFWVNNGCRANFKVCTVDSQNIACTSLDCSSIDYARQRCTIPNAVSITSVYIEEQLSRSECKKCGSYYHTEDALFVANGCRARFRVCYTTS